MFRKLSLRTRSGFDQAPAGPQRPPCQQCGRCGSRPLPPRFGVPMQIGLPKNVVQPLGPSAARSLLHRDFVG
eukprot:2706250-Prymnesium_polylepis.1